MGFVLEEWYLNVTESKCNLANSYLQNSQSHSKNGTQESTLLTTFFGDFDDLVQRAFPLQEIFLEEFYPPWVLPKGGGMRLLSG